jgi:hypothetical protein
MPTLYGKLSFSVRRVDANVLRFKIASGLSAKMILRPPLTAPLRGVIVNGQVCTSFDHDSVTIAESPADVICSIAHSG